MRIVLFCLCFFLVPFSATGSELNRIIAAGAPVVKIGPQGSDGRTDITRSVQIVPEVREDRPLLVAPNDQAIIVVHETAEVSIEGIDLRQTGNTEFAVYVNGGTLEISDCRFQGAFQTAIYVAAGKLIVRNCTFEEPIAGISAQPEAILEIYDAELSGTSLSGLAGTGASIKIERVRIAPNGGNGIQVQRGTSLDARTIAVSGNAKYGLFVTDDTALALTGAGFTGTAEIAIAAQDAGDLDISNTIVSGDIDTALLLNNPSSLEISDFLLAAAQKQIEVSGVRNARITRGQLQGRSERATAIFRDTPGLVLSSVSWDGPGQALSLMGEQSKTHVLDSMIVGATGHAVTLSEFQTDAGAVRLENLIVTNMGEDATAVYARNGGEFGLLNNRFAVQRAGAIYLDESRLQHSEGNVVVSLPSRIDARFLVQSDAETEAIAIDDGKALSVLERGRDQNEHLHPGFQSVSVSELLRRLADETPDLAAEILPLAATGAPIPASSLASGLLVLGSSADADQTLRRIFLEGPNEHTEWNKPSSLLSFFGPDGAPVNALWKDGSYLVPEGTLAAKMDGETVSILPATGDYLISPAIFDKPSLVWQDKDGKGVLGEAVRFRPREERALLLQGLPVPWRAFHVPGGVARIEAVTGPGRDATSVAHDRLVPLITEINKAHEAQDFGKRWELILQANRYLQIIAAFGDAEDSARLAAFQGSHADYHILRALAGLSMRIGGAATTTMRDFIDWQIEQGPDAAKTQSQLRMAAATGDDHALRALLLLHDDLAAEFPDKPVYLALDVLWLAPPEISLPRYRDFLKRARTEMLASIDAGEPISLDYQLITFWRAVGYASALFAAHGTPEDDALLALPLPATGEITELLPFVAAPERIAGAYFGNLGDVSVVRRRELTRRVGDIFCRAATMRPDTVRAGLRGDVVQEVYLALAERADDPQSFLNFLRNISELTATHCRPSGIAMEVGSIGNETPEREEQRKFGTMSHDMRWWYRPVRARTLAAEFTEDPTTEMHGLGAFSAEELAEMAGNPKADHWDALLLQHSLISDAWTNQEWHAPFGSERRLFRLRNAGGAGAFGILGYVDLRPLITDNRLFLVIGHSINTRNDDGPSAAITRQYDEPEFRDNGFRGTFHKVTLSRDGQLSEAEHVATLPDGTQIFEVPYSGDLFDTRVHMDLRYLDMAWQLDFALFRSELALRENFARAFDAEVQ
ncbi:MAG: right-handed parallel beta-helix repeat-containing protein [Pseudomonadota bacterium]